MFLLSHTKTCSQAFFHLNWKKNRKTSVAKRVQHLVPKARNSKCPNQMWWVRGSLSYVPWADVWEMAESWVFRPSWCTCIHPAVIIDLIIILWIVGEQINTIVIITRPLTSDVSKNKGINKLVRVNTKCLAWVLWFSFFSLVCGYASS